jgi:hypothetical protein
MALYHLIFYRSVREPCLLYYVAFITGFALLVLSLNGMGVRYLWSSLPWWDARSAAILIGLNCFFVLRFMKLFLKIGRDWPVINTLLAVFQALSVALAVSTAFLPFAVANLADALLAIACVFLILGTGLIALVRKHPSARAFLLAWGTLLASVLVSGLKDFDIIPDSLFTRYVLQIGSATQVILFAFALADRIDRMRGTPMPAGAGECRETNPAG